IFNVIEIVIHSPYCFFYSVEIAAASANLCPAGNSGPDVMTGHVTGDCQFKAEATRGSRWRMGPRAHQGHGSGKHIKQLRQLSNAVAPQETADACNSWIVA